MKRINILSILILLLSASSCHYLDIAPEMGLDEESVFSNLVNYKAFLENAYTGGAITGTSAEKLQNLRDASFPMRMDANDSRFSFYCLTEIADNGRTGYSQTIKAGSLGEIAVKFTTGDRFPIFAGMFTVIRIVNKCIDNIDMLQDATENEKEDILGQSYFIRAWAHYTLCNYFGGMPYLDYQLGPEDEWDLPRLSAMETYRRAAEDCLEAYAHFEKAGLIRRDPLPGQPGNLSAAEMNHPNGIAALCLRGRCLLYAASPLNNPSGETGIWEEAAKANAEALSKALEYGYLLIPLSEWKSNSWGARYTNEQIWGWNFSNKNTLAKGQVVNYNAYPFLNGSSAGATCPSQQAVDMFETIWGDPLYTEAERDAAYAITGEGSVGPDGKLHHYYEQNPYVNRDPRFYQIIIYDGAVTSGANPINIYYDPKLMKWPTTTLSGKVCPAGVAWNTDSSHGNSNTGYYLGKYWDGEYPVSSITYYQTDPLIRLAEVYLNYAEAVNEAYGPAGSSGGQISAVEAVNVVRDRAGMPPVQDKFTGSKEAFRERIRNERTVELMYEGHHYFKDSRRWKVAPERMRGPIMGMYIESIDVSPEYPVGRKYSRIPIPDNRQCSWKDAMYYFFLQKDEANKFKNFVNNEPW